MRRAVGISSLERTSATTASYNSLSDDLSATSLTNLQSQLSLFQNTLKSFALKHASKIKSDPEFRTAFSEMCNELGVDPLSGGKRGVWDWVGLGDWTFALAVQVVDICLSTRDRNGGLHGIDQVLEAIRSLRALPIENSSKQNIISSSNSSSSKPTGAISDLLNSSVTEPDILRAIKSLEPLGSGYSIVTIGSKKFIRSVTSELDDDSLIIIDSILSAHDFLGYTSHQNLKNSLNWTSERVKNALDKAVMNDSMLWIDTQVDENQNPANAHYYAPALFNFEDNHHTCGSADNE